MDKQRLRFFRLPEKTGKFPLISFSFAKRKQDAQCYERL